MQAQTIANEFLADAKKMILMSSLDIKKEMTDSEVMRGITFFAFGVERLLKFILAELNPIFVLKNGDFKNTVPALYKLKTINSDKYKVVVKDPDEDVISFKSAMQRAYIFSSSVKANAQLLHTLADYRDTLAHCVLSSIDFAKASRLLAKDGYCLIDQICKECRLDVRDFLGDNTIFLRNLSNKLMAEAEFQSTMVTRLAAHKKIWEDRVKQDDSLKAAKDKTTSLVGHFSKTNNYVPFSCPACQQESVACIEPDYDYDPTEKISYVVGVFVDSIKCYYCDLELTDYEELNFVDANAILESDF